MWTNISSVTLVLNLNPKKILDSSTVLWIEKVVERRDSFKLIKSL